MAPFDRSYTTFYVLVGHCKYNCMLFQFSSYLMLNNFDLEKVTEGH